MLHFLFENKKVLDDILVGSKFRFLDMKISSGKYNREKGDFAED